MVPAKPWAVTEEKISKAVARLVEAASTLQLIAIWIGGHG